jgi:hypothetical protein
MCFQLSLEYAIRKTRESQVGLKSNGTDQRLVCADNLLTENLNTINKEKDKVVS